MWSRRVKSMEDLAQAVETFGLLPLFSCGVPGWSVEEMCDPSVWFTDRDGPWEWKGRLAAEKRCVYGRLLGKKNAFVSLTWFPELANYRRDGYDFEGRCDDGLAPYKDKLLMTWLTAHDPALSKDAKRRCGFDKGFDTVLTRLEMQTYIINQDFVYSVDKEGRPYGWGNALLTTPERWLGEDLVNAAEQTAPAESLARILAYLKQNLPGASDQALLRELR